MTWSDGSRRRRSGDRKVGCGDHDGYGAGSAGRVVLVSLVGCSRVVAAGSGKRGLQGRYTICKRGCSQAGRTRREGSRTGRTVPAYSCFQRDLSIHISRARCGLQSGSAGRRGYRDANRRGSTGRIIAVSLVSGCDRVAAGIGKGCRQRCASVGKNFRPRSLARRAIPPDIRHREE